MRVPVGIGRSRGALDEFGKAVADRLARTQVPAVPTPSTAGDGSEVRVSGHGGRFLGELLVERGLVSEEQVHAALTQQSTSGRRLGDILVELGVLAPRALATALGEQLSLPVVDLAKETLDPTAVVRLPEDDARRLCAIPMREVEGRVDIAVGEPLAEGLHEQLMVVVGSPVRIHLAPRDDVVRAVDSAYRSDERITDALRAFEERAETRRRQQTTNQEHLVVVDDNAPVVVVLKSVLERAVRDRASDVHIEPQESTVRIRVRTDGALHDVMSLPHSVGAALVSRIKVLAEMNIVERRRPQDGQLEAEVSGRALDVRVATSPTVYGEMCVLRLLDKSRAFYKLSELGMPADTYRVYRELILSPYGMVICAGPTGSGKTTTLYATLAEINDDAIKVTTIEDPVEYVIPSINQIQINEQAGVTFASGLRAILRQDPDSILVGEIRDVETARIAVQAALTGHFVMSSLHATDATSALHRFIDMGIEPFLLSSSLLGVVGQRLVRRVCTHCVEPYSPTVDELEFYLSSGGDPDKRDFVHGAGCNFCGQTGYYDRVGVYEVLPVTDPVRELIVHSASHQELRETAVRGGMRTLRTQAIDLVTRDVTTVAEILRTVYVL
jgi:type IV pilus assembly protein PilB